MKASRLHSVLIAHPERQHSHQFAQALFERGILGLYVHGSALPASVTKRIPRKLRRYVRWFQPARRALALIASGKIGTIIFNALLRYYDRSLVRRLAGARYDAVIGYERSSLHTFGAAKKRGMICILDAASVHHVMQTKWLADANDAKLAALKDREIALADLIITCSTLARQSYLEAGVDEAKIRTVSLGVDAELFQPGRAKICDNSQVLRFCSTGRMIKLKGGDVLAAACHKLHNSSIEFSMAIAAPKIGAEPGVLKDLERHAELVGRVAHAELYKFYAKADVFVHPSRFESFGLVVTEALACGLPVIVTQNVGAKDMVTEGVNGWIIPPNDVDALYERMAWCVNNPQAVRAMSVAARESAMARNWDAYRREVAQVVSDFLDEHRTLAA